MQEAGRRHACACMARPGAGTRMGAVPVKDACICRCVAISMLNVHGMDACRGMQMMNLGTRCLGPCMRQRH